MVVVVVVVVVAAAIVAAAAAVNFIYLLNVTGKEYSTYICQFSTMEDC